MALASIRRRRRAAEQQVIDEGVRFLVNSVRPDGSWPIDTNLATWVTTLCVNALAAAGDLESLDTKEQILAWLLGQQYKDAAPLHRRRPRRLGVDRPARWRAGLRRHAGGDARSFAQPRTWLEPDLGRGLQVDVVGLQNRDGGLPTFCRGWGTLPFDRSGCDLTAHALRALLRGARLSDRTRTARCR